ncbi:MAG: esterase-like activity of phytase family protein, partial [Planctomycetaceae bacterium]
PVAEYVYRLGPPGGSGSRRAADGKISALTCVTADRLLVIEQSDDESRLYEVGIGDATDLLGRDEEEVGAHPVDGIEDLEAAGIRPVRKTLVADLAPLAARLQRDIEPGGDGRVPRKLADLKFEGLTVLADGRIAVLNDNDFDVVADGSAAAAPPRRRTCLWILTVPGVPRPE